MYPFGNKRRKQTHLSSQPIIEYLILASEPAESVLSKHTPTFSFVNRYFAKRHVLRRARHLKGHQP